MTPTPSRPASPGLPTGCVEDNLQPTVFDWNDDVDSPKIVDLELTWQEKERKYLRKLKAQSLQIKELQTFQQNVIKALHAMPSRGKFAKRGHESMTPGGQDGAVSNYHDEDCVQVVDQPGQQDGDGHRAQRALGSGSDGT